MAAKSINKNWVRLYTACSTKVSLAAVLIEVQKIVNGQTSNFFDLVILVQKGTQLQNDYNRFNRPADLLT